MNPQTLDALRAKLDLEVALGVLEPANQSIVKNILPIFAVGKKGEDGNIVLNSSSVRIVANCATNVNGATVYKARQADDIPEVIRTVTPYTKDGYVIVLDLTQSFYSFALAPHLRPYFVVQHPDYGLFQYTKMPQGWIQSPSQLRCFLQQILWKHRHNVRRYMDDIIIFGKTREELVKSFSGVLATLEYHDLRINGKNDSPGDFI